jgi:hypothetical protein
MRVRLCGVLLRPKERGDSRAAAHAESGSPATLPLSAVRSCAAAASYATIKESRSYARMQPAPLLRLVLLLLLPSARPSRPRPSSGCRSHQVAMPLATRAQSSLLTTLRLRKALPRSLLRILLWWMPSKIRAVRTRFADVGVHAAQAEDQCSRRHCF